MSLRAKHPLVLLRATRPWLCWFHLIRLRVTYSLSSTSSLIVMWRMLTGLCRCSSELWTEPASFLLCTKVNTFNLTFRDVIKLLSKVLPFGWKTRIFTYVQWHPPRLRTVGSFPSPCATYPDIINLLSETPVIIYDTIVPYHLRQISISLELDFHRFTAWCVTWFHYLSL